jgi:hypothetical protein
MVVHDLVPGDLPALPEARLMFEKPCRRPGCQTPVRKVMRSRLNAAQYCGRFCAAQHRVALGEHPFHQRTPEEIHRSALQGGRVRAERAKKRKYLEIARKFALPAEWAMRYPAMDLARMKALIVRAYREGHEDGYQAGHTKQYRAQGEARQKREAA